jgi:hypothetical protein
MTGAELAIRIPFRGEVQKRDIFAIGKVADQAGFHSGWLGWATDGVGLGTFCHGRLLHT